MHTIGPIASTQAHHLLSRVAARSRSAPSLRGSDGARAVTKFSVCVSNDSNDEAHHGVGGGAGVGRRRGVECRAGVSVGWPVPEGVAVGVTLGVGLGVVLAVRVVVTVGVAVGIDVAVGVADGVPTASAISTRPQPATLFGEPAVPHCL